MEALRHSPEDRISPRDATVHAYFTSLERVTSETPATSGGKGDPKLEALQEFLALFRSAHKTSSRWYVNVHRASIVDGVLAAFSGGGVGEEKLKRKLSVKFEGEPGIDCEGLTKELYTVFFGALCGGSELFETAEDSVHSLPGPGRGANPDPRWRIIPIPRISRKGTPRGTPRGFWTRRMRLWGA